MLSFTGEEALTGIRIIIEATTIRGDRRPRYRVRFQDSVLIEETWCPEFEACRLLFARGFEGKLEVWRATLPYACMRLDIEKAALLTVADTSSSGPRFVKWMPLPEIGVAGAVSRCEGSPGKRKKASRGSEHLPSETPAGWVGWCNMIVSGGQIRTARAGLGWSQTDLGRAAGLHRNAVGYWERHEKIPHGRYNEPVGVARMREALERAGMRFPKVRDQHMGRVLVASEPCRTQGKTAQIPTAHSCAQFAEARSGLPTQCRRPAFTKPKPECGARTRKGFPCKRLAYGNGRCRNHGGLSTGPKTQEGRRRCAEAARRSWAARRK